MFEARLRLLTPDGRWPLAPWFARAPSAIVHGFGFRFDEHGGAVGRYAAFPRGEPEEAFEDDLAARAPAPTTTAWRLVERRGASFHFEHRWTEPIMPGVPTPVRVAHDLFGARVVSATTATRDAFVVRFFIRARSVDPSLWAKLRASIESLYALRGLDVRIEAERFASVERAPESSRRARDVFETAFALGYYDAVPQATLAEVALTAGLPDAVAAAFLGEHEAADDPAALAERRKA